MTWAVRSLYADDTALLVSDDTLQLAEAAISRNLMRLLSLTDANHLKWQIKQNQIHDVWQHGSIDVNDRANLYIGTSKLDFCCEYDYLGIRLDNSLTFEAHIDNIIRNWNARLCTLSNIRKFIDERTAVIIYKAIIMSKLQYGMVFTISALQIFRHKIQITQNGALRICCLANRYSTNLSLHQRCHVLPTARRSRLDLLILMHRRVKGNFSCQVIIPNNNMRSLTRLTSCPTFTVPKPKSSVFLRSISYLGPKEWHALPAPIWQLSDLDAFKKCVR